MGSMEQPARILLVDDEPLILSAYQRTLRGLGVELEVAEGPLQGLRLLEGRAADVVIADYRMPGMNGDAFLEQVRQRWPDTVRILVTAYTDVHMVEDVVRRGGVFRFLTKPCEAQKLKEAVNEAIDQHRRVLATHRDSAKLKLDLHSYRHLFDSSPEPMMIADLDGRLAEVNEAFSRSAGESREEALRARPTIMCGREAPGCPWETIRASLERDAQWSGEVRHGDRFALLSISTLRDGEGKPYAYAAIEKDVTAQRHLEQASRAAQYEVILALAKLAEYRDPETGAHLERMRRYSQTLAREIARSPKYQGQLDPDYAEAIFYSSPLHDIGKVGIPDSVLLKPGKLTPEEWVTMQRHANIGAEVLAVAGDTLSHKTWLALARVIALQHHEKMDGSGYPNGLKGEEIDISARVVALADAYDAITSRRVYKAALPHEEARRRILESSGSHFDPDVVEAFLRCEAEFVAIKERYTDLEAEELHEKERYLSLAHAPAAS
ncbi:MAG: response regulator [Deltaproteobacteria bacterium]|nr:response regulator [Deltaproteobacteria bacterium]